MSPTTKEEQKAGIVNQIVELKEKADTLLNLTGDLDNCLSSITTSEEAEEQIGCRKSSDCQLEEDLNVLFEKLDRVQKQLASLHERIQL